MKWSAGALRAPPECRSPQSLRLDSRWAHQVRLRADNRLGGLIVSSGSTKMPRPSQAVKRSSAPLPDATFLGLSGQGGSPPAGRRRRFPFCGHYGSKGFSADSSTTQKTAGTRPTPIAPPLSQSHCGSGCPKLPLPLRCRCQQASRETKSCRLHNPPRTQLQESQPSLQALTERTAFS